MPERECVRRETEKMERDRDREKERQGEREGRGREVRKREKEKGEKEKGEKGKSRLCQSRDLPLQSHLFEGLSERNSVRKRRERREIDRGREGGR
jgi:hypothetical protein